MKRYSEVTHIDANGAEHQAIMLMWSDVGEMLRHEHAGYSDDDDALKAMLLADGAPSWVKDASGWIDEYGWGLIGPEMREEDEISEMSLAEAKAAWKATFTVEIDEFTGARTYERDEEAQIAIFDHVAQLIADESGWSEDSSDPEPDFAAAAKEFLDRQD